MPVKRINSTTEKNRFYQVSLPRKIGQSIEIRRCEERKDKGEILGTLRIRPEDAVRVFIEALLDAGVSAVEIHAHVFGLLHEISPDEIEYCMHKNRR